MTAERGMTAGQGAAEQVAAGQGAAGQGAAGQVAAGQVAAGQVAAGQGAARRRPVGRVRFMDAQRVNLDGFAVEDPGLGLVAMRSPYDPEPGLVIRDGRIVEMDGVAEEDFDSIDAYIARHGLDLAVAQEAMSLPDVAFARRLVSADVPRAEIVRLSAGATPAKLARVLALLRPPELGQAMTKMRARRTPSNQAHVTNRLDDPLLLAADSATAAAFGFREVETTVPVLADAPSNAVACLIGAAAGAQGVLIQCSVEEALELELGMRGLTSYAETVSLYGTEQVFTDGDDTPWSKAFLTSAYASRGMKMRVSSGAGAEVLMAGAERKSMLYLESRCVALARAIGAQGVQNGGIDGASVAASVPSGLRELMSENVMVMMRNLESCSGNDALMSESDMRRTSRTLPIVLAGSDFMFSGFGSIQRYDNMFGPSNFNAEDIDDFLAMQRDWGVDGGLRTVPEDRIGELRREAALMCRAVYQHLGLADFTDDHVERAVDAAGSKDLGETDTLAVVSAAQAIRDGGITVVDVVAALDETGYEAAAERILAMTAQRLAGDYLQTSAIFDEQLRVLSMVTDPNDYAGPGTGFEPSPERQAEIDAIRQARGVDDLRAEQATAAVPLLAVAAAGNGSGTLSRGGREVLGQNPREVVIGVSPAVGRDVWRCLSGLSVPEVLAELLAGLEEEGCTGRVVRFNDTVDLGRIGLAAARLAGSGIGIGLQGKGTALIHRRDLAPLANLELYSVAPAVTPELYRLLGANAARHAKGGTPDPARNPYTDEAIEARYHTTVIALMALERAWVRPGAPPEELSLEGLR
ncbi:MAG TPA: propanediol/glycerol family dehydratase large subunit [Streptosporangiaceae bacterium]|jgi:propanediol dehydratase large subunit|nr:propanediol/glycerol family dehydratase large subunit [Streptosporangiaceae bacterium]